jgi:hypothetical protein
MQHEDQSTAAILEVTTGNVSVFNIVWGTIIDLFSLWLD